MRPSDLPIVLCVFALLGCSGPDWIKSGAKQADLDAQHTKCENKAYESTGELIRIVTLENQCMRAEGWFASRQWE